MKIPPRFPASDLLKSGSGNAIVPNGVHATNVASDNGPSLPFLEAGIVVFFSARLRVASFGKTVCVPNIFSSGYVLKIVGTIIALVKVLVVYLLSFWPRTEESGGHKNVNLAASKFWRSIQHDLKIAALMRRWFQYDWHSSIRPAWGRPDAPHAALIRHFVESFKSNNCAPLFSHGAHHITSI